jgi:hypothetical protein
MPFNPSFDIPLEQGLSSYEVYPAALAAIQNLGFNEPPRPMIQTAAGPMPYDGSIPGDLNHLNDGELGHLLGLLSQLLHYINWHFGKVFGERQSAVKEFEYTAAKLRLSYKMDDNNKKRTEGEIKDRTVCDSRYIQADSRACYCEAAYRHLSYIQKSVEQNFTAISRRITQRGQDVERGRREGSVQDIKGTPTFRRPG